MNPEAVLALISELYSNLGKATEAVRQLQEENAALLQGVTPESGTASAPTPPSD